MNIERIQLKGQLTESKAKFKNLDVEASALVILIRSLLNPFEEDTTKLDTQKVIVSTQRLDELVTELKNLKSKIQKLEEYFE